METNTYEFLTGEVVAIEATSEEEAWQLLGAGAYEEVETLSELRDKPCKSCSDPAAPGWHVDDDAGITFGGLKKAQNKVMEEIAGYIAHIYFTKSSEVFNDLMEDIADETFNAAKFGGYSENCEWLARANGGN